jgi:hypothetical protein
MVITCAKKEKEAIPEDQLLDTLQQTAIPDEYKSLLNKEFGPDSFPNGFEEQTGVVIGFVEGNEFIIAHVTKKETQMLWFCKLTHRDQEGRPFLKILDIIIMPSIHSEEQLLLGNCKFEGIFDQEIITVVKFFDNHSQVEVRHAWRANRTTMRLEKVSLEKVTCSDQSYYL